MKRNLRISGARLAPVLKTVLICLATCALMFAPLYAGITPEQYDIQVGAPAPIEILATKDVVDSVTTEQLKNNAAASVEPSYKSADFSGVDGVLNDLSARFDVLRSAYNDWSAGEADAQTLISDAELTDLNEKLGFSLTRDQLNTLLATERQTLEALFEAALTEVKGTLMSTLPEGQESVAVKNIRLELTRKYPAQLVGVVTELIRGCIRPTMLIDEEITEQNREKARDAVEAKMCVKGQVIVRKGEIVTLAQYTMISSLGLLADDSFDIQTLLGIALLVIALELALIAYLYRFQKSLLESPKQMMLLSLVLVLAVWLCFVFRYVNVYFMPVALALLLVSMLMDAQLALFVNLIVALLASMMTTGSGMIAIVLMACVSGPFIAMLFNKSMMRMTTLLAGVLIGVGNFLITLGVGLFNSVEIRTVLINALWAAGGGAVSAVICIGVQPVLEWLFNLATASKLIELSNPNQPLLRRLLLEASGTYHHSIIVANLAEAACSAIGANGLLARVGAYYHDIGKLKRPMYFKENQMGDNPHDRTDPRVSTAILTAHPRDGAAMAQKARIPEPVIDIIRQHHGDCPVMFFYDKALKLYGDQVDISAFRYEGPRPQTREAAVVMMADSIEAATRALPNPDPEKIDALIRKIVRGKLNDGQLDCSNLTFNDLEKICSAFSTVLTGVFHERIEYPTIAIPPRGEAAPKPAGGEARSASTEAKPAPAEAQPVPAEVKPAAEVKTAPAEAKSAADAKSVPAEVKPTAEAKTVAAEVKPAPAQAKPADKKSSTENQSSAVEGLKEAANAND
ncbi:MAG: HDIG domain-containing protein [Clostridia bacterium]|nr:HDIG domain-containing protein [Clostridia bacterium]